MGYDKVIGFIEIIKIDDVKEKYDFPGNNYVFISDHKAIYIEDENYNLLDKYAEVE